MLDEYDIQTVLVDHENYKSSKAKLEDEEMGEEDVIYEKIVEEEEEGEAGVEGEEEYYLVEEEEIIEEGVEDAHSEGMPNIEDEDLREEHLQAIKVHRKRKDYEVFVGGLDWYYSIYCITIFYMSDALVIYFFHLDTACNPFFEFF